MKKNFFENLSQACVLGNLHETLPFFIRDNFIIETMYPLTLLDLIEFLIALMMKEISMEKFRRGLLDYEEKLKSEQENARKAKKSIRMVPRKK